MTTNKNMIINNIPECPGNKNIQSAVISQNPPNNTNVLWLKPYSNQFSIKVHNGGQWVNCGVSKATEGGVSIIDFDETKTVEDNGQSQTIRLVAKAIVVYIYDYDQYIDLNKILSENDILINDLITVKSKDYIDLTTNNGTLNSDRNLVIIPIFLKDVTGSARTQIKFTLSSTSDFDIYILVNVFFFFFYILLNILHNRIVYLYNK